MIFSCRKVLFVISYEATLPIPCSDVAALLGTNAIRILYAGAICDDGGVRIDGLPLFHNKEKHCCMGVCNSGFIVPAYI